MKKRILGIDVARALAVIGMIIVNFKMVFGQEGAPWLQAISGFVDGKAAATFVVLAGVGIAFVTNATGAHQDIERLKQARAKLLKRALFLFVVGLSYIAIWPADILHFYGIYLLVAIPFVTFKPTVSLIAAWLFIFSYPLLMVIFSYDAGWDFTTYTYLDFWTPVGFVRNLFYNGFHPVVPWAAFVLVGLWYGRQNLNDDRFVKRTMGVSAFVAVGMHLLSWLSIRHLSEGNVQSVQELSLVLGMSPMPPLPIYMLSGSSMALFVISASILLARRLPTHAIVRALASTGQLALTFYVAHVVIGMGVVEEFGAAELGAYSLQFSVVYALAFSAVCVLFAVIWTRYNRSGPLEWLMRKAIG